MSSAAPNNCDNANVVTSSQMRPDQIPRLHVATNPPPTWYSQKGGKNNRIHVKLEFRGRIPLDCYSLITDGDKVPLSWAILKEDGTMVSGEDKHEYAVFSVAENANVMMPELSMSLSSTVVDLYFRYTCISKNAGGSLRLHFKVGDRYTATTGHTQVLTKQNTKRRLQREQRSVMKRRNLVPAAAAAMPARSSKLGYARAFKATEPPTKGTLSSSGSSDSGESADTRSIADDNSSHSVKMESRGLGRGPMPTQRRQFALNKIPRRELEQRVLETEHKYQEMRADHDQLRADHDQLFQQVARMHTMMQKFMCSAGDSSGAGVLGTDMPALMPTTPLTDCWGGADNNKMLGGLGSECAADMDLQSMCNFSLADAASVCGSVSTRRSVVCVKSESRVFNSTAPLSLVSSQGSNDEDDEDEHGSECDEHEKQDGGGGERDHLLLGCLEGLADDDLPDVAHFPSIMMCTSPPAGEFFNDGGSEFCI